MRYKFLNSALDDGWRLHRPESPERPFQNPIVSFFYSRRHNKIDNLENSDEQTQRNRLHRQGQWESGSYDRLDGAVQSLRPEFMIQVIICDVSIILSHKNQIDVSVDIANQYFVLFGLSIELYFDD
jgi:hypothetical protein